MFIAARYLISYRSPLGATASWLLVNGGTSLSPSWSAAYISARFSAQSGRSNARRNAAIAAPPCSKAELSEYGIARHYTASRSPEVTDNLHCFSRADTPPHRALGYGGYRSFIFDTLWV